MPELPEVESTVLYLRDRVANELIHNVEVNWARTVQHPSVEDFKLKLVGRLISAVQRRGKYIVFVLESDSQKPCFLFSHLRMTGSFDVVEHDAPLSKHDRVLLQLKSGKEIRFNDPRKFGRFYLGNEKDSCTSHLGPEPLDSSFTAEVLMQILQTRSGRMKSVLLDQSAIAGLGNIYADEVLWASRIHPLLPAKRVTSTQAKLLHRSIQKILRKAIESKGTDFGDGVVTYGMYRPKVYGRAEQKCPRCSSLIKRIVVGQRSTHYCPKCQVK
jgi:formamidopyrimidine-DNA glycosylase